MKTKCYKCNKEINLVKEDGYHDLGKGNKCKECDKNDV